MKITFRDGWLEPLETSHAEALYELIHSSRALLYPWMPWLERIHSVPDTSAFIHELVQKHGPQFVIQRDEHICGSVGFYFLDSKKRLGSLGYWLGEEFIGQGIMSDAISALCRHGFMDLKLEKVEIRCADGNEASRKIPERLGFLFDGTISKAEWLIDRYVDHACYSMLKEEFISLFVQKQNAANS